MPTALVGTGQIDKTKHCYYRHGMHKNIAFLATDVGRLFRKRFDVAAHHFGVTGPQWRMLAAVGRDPGARQGTLAAALDVEAITAGRMLDRLEKLGLVKRLPDPADRRAWQLFLTESAERLMDQLGGCATPVFDEALRGFSDAEHDMLTALLERVRANLSDDDQFPKATQDHG